MLLKKVVRRARAHRGTTRALVRDQRAVNEELVLSSLRAHEQTEAATARELLLLETAELRERLLGILGHDLRTPLGAIMMSGGILLAHHKLDDEDVRVVGRLLHSAKRMNRMITQILDFTRTRLGGGMLLDLRLTNLADVCRSVTGELSLTASVAVQCVAEGRVMANFDADRLAEVIANIAGNAAEHAWEGTSVIIHAFAEGADAVVEISNQGNPIPPDVLPFIFEPFRRAKQREHSPAGNLGLGLYIASEITRAHHGSLMATSSDGTTRFTIRLPHAATIPPTQTLAEAQTRSR